MTVRHTLQLSSLAMIAAGTLLATPHAQAEESSPVNISREGASRMIEACLNYAAQKKWPPLSIAVVDAGGTLIRFDRENAASSVTVAAALLKARTAARLGMPTADLTTQDPATRDLFIMLQITALPGGAPLLRGNTAIGAVGVSGADPTQDRECTERAVAAVKTS